MIRNRGNFQEKIPRKRITDQNIILRAKKDIKMSDSGEDSDFEESKFSTGKKRKAGNSKARPGKKPKIQEVDPTKFCRHCRQRLVENDCLRFHESAPEGAIDEYIALTNPDLKTDMFGSDDEDPRPEVRATQVLVLITLPSRFIHIMLRDSLTQIP
jgi:hypothetical protein